MTPQALPLAAAQARLGRPGRTRKLPAPAPPLASVGVDGDRHGDNRADERLSAPSKSAPAQPSPRPRALASTASVQEIHPRLLTVTGACRYLSLGEDTVLELIQAGTFRRVTIPAPVTAKRHGGAIRRVLLDRLQLDEAIAAWIRA